MHKILNIYENKNYLHNITVNYKTNILNFVSS